MAKETTSKEIAKIAAKLMKSKDPDVRKVAASVLTQRETGKKRKKCCTGR